MASKKKKHAFEENFKLGKVLGKGAFGKVCTVEDLGSGKFYAAKIMRLARVPHGFVQQIKNEAAIMEKLHHPNICKFYKFFFGKGSKQAILVMELAEGEVLSEFVRESKLLELHDVRKIIRCILKALAYMHARHITHRDLKPDNIFLKHRHDCSSVKIGDFGLSKESKLRMKMPCGTIQYCAPELLSEPCRYSNAVDVWSAGIILIQLLVGSHPFSELKKLDFNKLDKHPKKRDLVLNFQIENMPTYSKIPKLPRTLLSSMMVVDSTKRVKAKDALRDTFIASTPAEKEPAASKESVPQVISDTGLVLPTITSRSPQKHSANVHEGASPEHNLHRIKLPKTGRVRDISHDIKDLDSPQHKQARSKRGDITGPKAGANTSKSRAHEAAPSQTAKYTRSLDRREISQPWRYEAKNAQTTAMSPRRSKHNDISGPKPRHLKSRGGYEGAALERNVIKLPKTGANVDFEILRDGVRYIAKHGKNLERSRKIQLDSISPEQRKARVTGPMSPRIAARNAAKRHLSIGDANLGSTIRATMLQRTHNMRRAQFKNSHINSIDSDRNFLSSPNLGHYFGKPTSPMNKSQTRNTNVVAKESPIDIAGKASIRRLQLRSTNSIDSRDYLSSSNMGKHYFSESMSPMRKSQTRSTSVVAKESPVDVVEKARDILRKGLDSTT